MFLNFYLLYSLQAPGCSLGEFNFFPVSDDDDMTDLAEAIMEDCDGEVRDENVNIDPELIRYLR